MHRRIAARIVGRPAIVARRGPPLVLGNLLIGEELFAGEVRRALERRGGAVVPDALEVRLSVGRPRRHPAGGPGGGGGLRRRGCRRHDDGHQDDGRAPDHGWLPSWKRAPFKMFATAWFPSWQAYSKMR